MSSSPQSSRQIHLSIVVQPPTMVGLGEFLVPPVVARTSDPEILQIAMGHATKYIFASLVLESTTGKIYTAALNEGASDSGHLVQNSGGSGGSSSSAGYYVYFIFNSVSISKAGTYTIAVLVHIMENATCWTVGKKSTRQITVVNDAVPAERPSKSHPFLDLQGPRD